MAPERSAIAIRARSNVGPITFVTLGLEGSIEAIIDDGAVSSATTANLSVRLDTLHSGNKLYDAELLRRIDARRFPTAEVELRGAARVAGTDRFQLAGELTVHGQTELLEGVVNVVYDDAGVIAVDAEHVVDIRDFGISTPTMLMLKIYPQVRVELHVEADETGRS